MFIVKNSHELCTLHFLAEIQQMCKKSFVEFGSRYAVPTPDFVFIVKNSHELCTSHFLGKTQEIRNKSFVKHSLRYAAPTPNFYVYPGLS